DDGVFVPEVVDHKRFIRIRGFKRLDARAGDKYNGNYDGGEQNRWVRIWLFSVETPSNIMLGTNPARPYRERTSRPITESHFMTLVRKSMSILLVLPLIAPPALADLKYTAQS